MPSLNSPIYSSIMSDIQNNKDLASIDNLQARTKLSDVDTQVKELERLADVKGQDLNREPMDKGMNPNPTGSNNFMSTLFDVETKGGTIPDRPGSQYKGIAQLGDDIRKPLLKKHGYTEEQYNSNKDIQKKLAAEHIDTLKARLNKNGIPSTDLDLWTAHNMGVAGRNQIMSGKVSPTVLKNLRNQKGMNSKSTPKDYLEYYGKIFS